MKTLFRMFFAFLAAVSFTVSAADGGSGSRTAQEKEFDKNSIASVREYAEKGSPEAQYYLALHYENEKNMEEAARWYRKSAEQNDLDAQYKLGLCYDKGEGVPQNSKEAVKWYRKAADHGIVEAQFNLGSCYEKGIGVERSIPNAVEWYRKAADGRSIEAQYKLGFCYENYGEVQSDDKAAIWYRRAAERGNAGAQYKIGHFYKTGKGVDKNALEAVHWYTKAADQGNSDASFKLGQLYESGAGGVPRDMSVAIKWYKKAAELGYGDAPFLYWLGSIFDTGEEVKRNYPEAMKWYTKAAELGSGEAQAKLDQYEEQKRRKEVERISAEQKRQEEAERKAKERRRLEEAERIAREEAARKVEQQRRQEEAARIAREEAERKAREEARKTEQQRRQEEAARKKEEAARKAREEAERKAMEAEAVRKAAAELVKMSVKMSGKMTTIHFPNGSELEMLKVEAGTFEMSAEDGENKPDEIPHKATLTQDFYIGRTEVTQAQWMTVMGFNPSAFKGDDRPVDQVSWNDAMMFCENLNNSGKAPSGWNFTLPTETQWEYAARGGKNSKGYKYSGSDKISDVGWYRTDNRDVKTQPVGKKTANELGLYDMSGNVWEWCLDEWNNQSDKLTAEFSPERKNAGADSKYVERGGSWYCYSYYCRSSGIRYFHGADERIYDLGFRLALVPVK